MINSSDHSSENSFVTLTGIKVLLGIELINPRGMCKVTDAFHLHYELPNFTDVKLLNSCFCFLDYNRTTMALVL